MEEAAVPLVQPEGIYQRKKFDGIVFLKNWLMWTDGHAYRSFQGVCSVLTDEEGVGIKVRGGDTANWFVRVEGPSGNAMHILGCQILAVFSYDGDRQIPQNGTEHLVMQ